LEGAGGVEYLMKQAGENPTAFLTLLGKVLPLQVSASGTFRLEAEWLREVAVSRGWASTATPPALNS
jgi:hypothetical protein